MSYTWYPRRLWIVPEAARDTTKPLFSLCVHQFFWLLGMSGSTCVNTSICMTAQIHVHVCAGLYTYLTTHTRVFIGRFHMYEHILCVFLCTYIRVCGVCVYLIRHPSLWLWECILAYHTAPEHHSKFHHKGVTTFPVGGRWGYRRHLGGSLLGTCLL